MFQRDILSRFRMMEEKQEGEGGVFCILGKLGLNVLPNLPILMGYSKKYPPPPPPPSIGDT